MNYSDVKFLYVYATQRDDGLTFAVGAATVSGPVHGSIALFASRDDVLMFVDAVRERYGVPVNLLPTVVGGEGYIELPNGSFWPSTTTTHKTV